MSESILDESISSDGKVIWNKKTASTIASIGGFAFFLGICGIIAAGFLIVVALVFMIGMGVLASKVSLPFPASGFGALYLVIGLILLAPAVYMTIAGNRLRKAERKKFSQSELELGLASFRSYFLITSILVGIVALIYAIIFLIATVGALGSALK